MAASLYRGPLPTLTEDDVREAGERATMPPPVPIDDIVAGMMDGHDVPPELEAHELAPPEDARVIEEASRAYLAQLGSTTAVPVRCRRERGLDAMPLDHLAGFVLSLIDGRTSVEDVVDIASMPRLDVLRVLCELRDLGVIELRRAG